MSVHKMTSHLSSAVDMPHHELSNNSDNDDCGMSQTESIQQHDCCGPTDVMQDSCTHSDCHCDNLIHAPALGLLPPIAINATQNITMVSDYRSKPPRYRGETNYRPPILA